MTRRSSRKCVVQLRPDLDFLLRNGCRLRVLPGLFSLRVRQLLFPIFLLAIFPLVAGFNFAQKFYAGGREPSDEDREEQARFRLMLVTSLVDIRKHEDGSGRLMAAAISARLGLISNFKHLDEEIINSFALCHIMHEYGAFSCTIFMDCTVHK